MACSMTGILGACFIMGMSTLGSALATPWNRDEIVLLERKPRWYNVFA